MSEVPERKAVISERAPGRMFDIYEAPQIENIFADGFGRVFMGPHLSRVELYRAIGAREGTTDGVSTIIEEREIFCRLTVPTVALAEACSAVIQQIGMNLSNLDIAHQQLKKVVADAIEKAAAVKM